jgi:phage replication O-like protein O
MSEPVTIHPPNYTQIPNAILDLMADMSDAELRVVLAIARQTFGWHKKRDKISLSQLRALTGMSKQGVINGLDAGIRRGLIERRPDPNDNRGGIWYRLLVHDVDRSSTLTGQEVDQSTTLTGSSPRRRQDLVHGVDTQKKEKESKERESEDQPQTQPAPSLYQHPGIVTYTVITGLKPDKIGAERIANEVVDIPRWEQAIKDWLVSGYKAINIKGMTDWYNGKGRHQQNGNRPQERPPPRPPPIQPVEGTLPRDQIAAIARNSRGPKPNDTS